jgi:hypothetical protein
MFLVRWGMHSPGRTMIRPEKEHSFHFGTGKRENMRTATKISTTWFAGGQFFYAHVEGAFT